MKKRKKPAKTKKTKAKKTKTKKVKKTKTKKVKKVKKAKKPALAKGKAVAKKRKKPIEVRVSRAVGDAWVLETIYVSEHRFQPGAMIDLSTGKRSKFISIKPRPDVWLIIGCLPKDYDAKQDRCVRTTVHKQIKKITEAKARKLKAANPQLMIISNPCRRYENILCPRKVTKPKRAPKAKKSGKKKVMKKGASKNKVRPADALDVARVGRAFKRFHFTKPLQTSDVDVPQGYPNAFMFIGKCNRFDVKTPSGRVVSRTWSGKGRPNLCTDAKMKDVFILGQRSLNVPSGKAKRVDYSVPPHSGRNKWARHWWHPHETEPKATPSKNGRCVRVSGRGLTVTPRGIEG